MRAGYFAYTIAPSGVLLPSLHVGDTLQRGTANTPSLPAAVGCSTFVVIAPAVSAASIQRLFRCVPNVAPKATIRQPRGQAGDRETTRPCSRREVCSGIDFYRQFLNNASHLVSVKCTSRHIGEFARRVQDGWRKTCVLEYWTQTTMNKSLPFTNHVRIISTAITLYVYYSTAV